MKKKLFLGLFLVSLFSAFCFGQEDAGAVEENGSAAVVAENSNQEVLTQTTIFDDKEVTIKKRKFDFVLQFEPTIYVNPESSKVSAPSPIVYPITFGFLWPNEAVFAIQPTIGFFMMNHLNYEGKALPAEIENRTTNTICLMLNIPVVYSLRFNRFRVQVQGGLGILFRFGLLSGGVSEDDSGYSGTAGKDVEEINKWFWSNMHFLYLTTGASCLFNLTESLKAGPLIEMSFPLGSVFSGEGLQGMLISAGIKISF